MVRLLLLSIGFTFSANVFSQRLAEPLDPPPPPDLNDTIKRENEIFTIVEQMPEFLEGGEKGLKDFLSMNIRYPENAKEIGAEGIVYIQYVVLKDGTLNDFKVLRGVKGAQDLDKEAIRVVKLTSGKWKPGKQNGIPVNVRMNLPVRFKLQ
jgi:TonB family protein